MEGSTMGTKSTGPKGIGGWLLLPAVGLVLTPFRMGVQFYRDLLPSLTPEIWHALTSPGSSAYHPLWGPLIICEMLLNGALSKVPLRALFESLSLVTAEQSSYFCIRDHLFLHVFQTGTYDPLEVLLRGAKNSF